MVALVLKTELERIQGGAAEHPVTLLDQDVKNDVVDSTCVGLELGEDPGDAFGTMIGGPAQHADKSGSQSEGLFSWFGSRVGGGGATHAAERQLGDDLNIGRTIGRNWRVVRKIGQGAMGTVWEVRHKDVRRLRSAVKEIKAGLTNNQEVVRRFLREVRLMAELEGVDNIVRVTEFDRQEGFVLMTLVDGPSLAQVIEQHGALPYEQVVRFGCQIATALGIVHERGIVHRDIKPPNILIDEKNQKAYLTDFGIAKKLDLSEGDETVDGILAVEEPLAVDFHYMGTPRYSSPEQLRVEYPPTPLWDIYATGVLLYEAYSGLRFLPQCKKYHEFLQSIDLAFEITLPYPKTPPTKFAEIIEHCLQRDPAKRMPSASELAVRLQECGRELSSTV